ncbi:MAG: hypothetical protein HYU66_12975 [Armatimonadetes bacterium]|nr:hypothetical protein [Armatimonadota bacterium]
MPANLFAQAEERREAARHVDWKFSLYPAQQEIEADAHRFKTVCNGRRWGKSFLASHAAVERANAEQGLVMLTAPTYKTAKNGVWAHLLNNLPAQYRAVHQSDMTVELTGGGRVLVGSLDQADNLRGAGTGLVGIIVDEAAFVPDYAVENVLRPMLMDCNGWLLAISTPKGRRGWFYRYWLRGQSGDVQDAAYRSWSMPTWTNPTLPNIEAEIDDLRNSMPENVFQQEIAAAFVDDVGQVFRDVQLCELAKRQVGKDGLPVPIPGADYYVGIDFARSGSDYTVITVLEKLDDGTLSLVWLDRWGRIPDEEPINRLARVILHFQPRRSIGEENSFGGVYMAWMASKYHIKVDLFNTTGQSKEPLVQQLAAAIEFHRLDLWPESDPLGKVLVNELLSYERQETAEGHATYSAPVGYHDDCVMSLCMAVRAAEGELGGDAVVGGHIEGSVEDWMLQRWEAPAVERGGVLVPGGARFGRRW